MPVWEVSEPYINLWLHDVPLGYQPGPGRSVAFKLSYKQREARSISSGIFSLGPKWNCSWLSYVVDDGYGMYATMVAPGGGERTYDVGNAAPEYFSRTVIERQTDGDDLTGFVVSYANGAKDYYSFVPETVRVDFCAVAFLTASVDPSAHTNRFVYQETTNAVKLLFAVDTDGRTNTVSYTNATFSAQITGVTDPFNRSCILEYNADGVLTNVTDTASLSSSIMYDSEGWVTNLVTPYGTTRFEHFLNTQDPDNEFLGNNTFVFVRAMRVVDAAGGTNIYMLRQDSSRVYTNAMDFWTNYDNYLPYLTDGYYDAMVPADVPPYGYVGRWSMEYRNSFHWCPKQADGLPVNLTALLPSDLMRARLRHWLHKQASTSISGTLGMEQSPSPDGTEAGQTTWYQYDGMVESSYSTEGTNSRPCLVSRLLPDGTTWYTFYQRDEWGRITNAVETYSTGYGVTPLTRTNRYVYDGADLIRHIGPDGVVEDGYAYNADHQVLRHTNAVGDVTYYTYDGQKRLTSTKTPAGLTRAQLTVSGGVKIFSFCTGL